MNSKKEIWLKISGVIGVLTPIIAFTFILLAIAHSPQFSWTKNALSDLGVQKGTTAVLFNNGLIISGILVIFFATGLFKFFQENLVGKVGAFVFLLDAFALTAIGIFPENVKPLHFYASVAFFMLHPVSMLFISIALLRASKVKLGFFTFMTAVIAAFVWALPFWEGVAIPETLSALSVSIWFIVLGFEMFRKGVCQKTINAVAS